MNQIAVIIIAILALIFVLSVFVINTQTDRAKKYISGMWVGDKHFLESSGLKDIQLFISPVDKGKYQGYLIMIGDDDQFISNQALEFNKINFSMGSTISGFYAKIDDKNQGTMQIEYDTYESMPKSMKFTLSILNGTLALHDGENIYAFMTKDISTSHMAIMAYNSEE